MGLDPQIRQDLWQTIGAVRRSGATVVLTTHYIEEAERLCDTVAVVHHGRLLTAGSPAELIVRHVGTEHVVEVHGYEQLRATVALAAAAAGITSRPAGTSVALFADDVRLDGLGLPGGLTEHRTRRPANLEDVFVSLTGTAL